MVVTTSRQTTKKVGKGRQGEIGTGGTQLYTKS